MPSRSVEAATREEAVAAARAEFGASARVVGVRRIRSGGMFGFFTNERFIAEVEVPTAGATAGPSTGSSTVLKDPAGPARPAAAAGPSMDDRMKELADLLGAAAQGDPDVDLYGRSGSVRTPAGATAAAAPAGRTAPGRATASPTGSAAGARSTARPARAAAAAAAPVAAKPFIPAKHTLMLSAEDLVPTPAPAPVADEPSGPSPFAAALTRMVASTPVQAAADAAVEDAAVAAAAELAAAEAAAAQTAAVEAAAAEAARLATARIEAAAAEAARVQAEAVRAEAARIEAARLQAEAEAAAEAARIQAETEAARIQAEAAVEAARIQAEAAAEAARIQAEIEAAAEAARIQAEAAAAAARIQAEIEAAAEVARIEAARIEAARVQTEAAEAARIEAARIEAARLETAAPALSMVESVRSADEELADLLEEVLAANGSGRGRHRSPEAGAERSAATADQDGDAAVAAASAIIESAAARAWPAPALAEDRVRDVPQPWAYQTTVAEPNAYDTGAYRTDAHAGYASDDRIAQRAAQFAAAQSLVVDAVVVDESPAEEVRFMESPSIDQRERFAVPMALSPVMSPAMAPAMAPEMARTASDPAPLPLDATAVLPPLSLMPPQHFGGSQPLLASRPGVPPVRRSRPPVPASTRPALSGRPQAPTRPTALPVAPRPAAPALPAADEPGGRLATVTRLVPAPSSTALAPYPMSGPEELVLRLLTLGLPDSLLGPDFTSDAAARGVYAALTRTLSERLPAAPPAPTEPGDVLMLVGPGAETFAAARSLASSLRLEPEAVLWAASGALAGLAPESSRITSLETALARRRTSATTGAVTVVAVDAPLRTSGGPWMEHMLSVWSPTAVWAVMDATRKPEDLVPWLDGLPRLDAVVVEDTDSTADPAAVLDHVHVPVAMVDGTRATAHRWASLLCERLEEMEA
ncbi:hypothetical protein [Modestobacter sp. VKM Ac-2984]|uniref:hypothetical protein n=1 Tax=Modestobacter sp. VKM Ac-2984 TaxID=3004138 RepID=UPI0022AAD08B|nr:hypothetical protein [Modestobacter sp. VKM Ac-2984]MCZ2817805.1 hypothetical protein [Modestobacter sp. VKM Ac-2984]